MSARTSRFSFPRAAVAAGLIPIIVASGILMVGPQILIIVPTAIGAGIALALRRSFWSLACFGYPFVFGLVSAWIGYREMAGYERTVGFAISVGIGLVGVCLVAVGVCCAMVGGRGKEASVSAG